MKQKFIALNQIKHLIAYTKQIDKLYVTIELYMLVVMENKNQQKVIIGNMSIKILYANTEVTCQTNSTVERRG